VPHGFPAAAADCRNNSKGTVMITTRQGRLKLTSWTIPLTYTVVTLVVGFTFPRVEHHLFPHVVSTISASSAIAICSSIASGMIALTGIVFSLAFVMVQFSATAYSPRLVLWVARDPVVSHALGMFTATFLYALIQLAWLDRGASGKVPFVSTLMVVALLIASVGMFIALIERLGLLQVNRMLIFTGDRGRQAIEELYSSTGSAAASGTADKAKLSELRVTQTLIHTGRPQVIQAIRVAELLTLASESGAVIDVAAAVGDTVLHQTPLVRVYSARQPLDEQRLKAAFEIGDERTFEQDPKYAIRLVVDIAIKALSPAINDPTTAVTALDQIEDLLIRLGHCRLDIGDYRDSQGALRLVVPFPTWDDFLRLSLDEIRFCGANSVQVMRRMNALVENLSEVLPAERHEALHHWAERLQVTVDRTFRDEDEKQDASVADRQGLGIGEEKRRRRTVSGSPSVERTNREGRDRSAGQ
jgi:uncharacterized membrane protein